MWYFWETFFRVQSENEGYTGKAPEKVIIAKNTTLHYQINKSYNKIDDWEPSLKVYGYNNAEEYCKTDNSVIIPLDSKLVNEEIITDRIKNNMFKQPGRISDDFKRFMGGRHIIPKDRLETIALKIGAME